jgi:hypothetical protein
MVRTRALQCSGGNKGAYGAPHVVYAEHYRCLFVRQENAGQRRNSTSGAHLRLLTLA